MFDNIGGKIQGLAVAVCWFGIVASVIVALALFMMDIALVGMCVLIGGCVLSWVGSFCLYGFGQLIEDTSAIRELLKDNGMPQNTSVAQSQKPVVAAPVAQSERPAAAAPVDKPHTVAWKCPKCSGFNGSEAEKCQFCGKSKA